MPQLTKLLQHDLSPYLQRIDIMSDHHKLGFLLLDEGSHGVDSRPDHGGTLGGGIVSALGTLLSTGLQSLLLLLLGLRPVFVQKTEQLGS